MTSVRTLMTVVLLLCGCSGAPEALSNGSAESVIESVFSHRNVGLLLGDVKFVASEPDGSNGREILTELPLYRAFEKKGFIVISKERDLTNRFSGWGDWMALSAEQVRRVATVAVTELGRKSGTIETSGDREVLWLSIGRSKIQKVVANELVVSGADKYRVIMGTHTFDVPPDLLAAWEEARDPASVRERRLKCLLKFDPFETQWKVVAGDVGPRTGAFWSNNVDQIVQTLR